MELELSPGTRWAANGRVVEINGAASLTHVEARDLATGELLTVSIDSLHALAEPKESRDLNRIESAEWERASALAKDLAPLRGRQRVSRALLLRIAKRHHMGLRQLQRTREIYSKDPRVSSLARSKGGRPKGLNLLDPKVDRLIRHTIRKFYCKRERPHKSELVRRTQSLARRLKIDPPPSRNAVLARLAQEDTYRVDVARLGSKAAKQVHEPRPGKLAVSKPLELVQIDHTPADVRLLSDDRLTVIGRPWVTVAIDVATRCVIGMYISMEPPSTVATSLCIEHMALPKPENLETPNLWPMYGKPERILVDNGKDFRADALIAGCREREINLEWRPVRTPHYGAHIERLIGTLMQLAHLLSGTTFSNIRQRGDYDSDKHARLTLAEYRAWMVDVVCRHYHARTHSALGCSPRVAWERGRQKDGRYVPPPLPANRVEFRMDFLPYKYRLVKRTGIELFTSRYWHADLAPLIGKHEDVAVRYDPRDPSRVWVRHEGRLIEAHAIAGPGLEGYKAKQRMDAAETARMEAELDAGYAHRDRIEANAERATKAARRAAAKGGKPPDTPAPALPPPMRDDAVAPMPVETPRSPDAQADLFGFPIIRPPKSRPAMPVEEWN
jgi:putative transposase